MRRISTPTAAQDLFGPGKHGFRNGDPANAILATRLQAEWFNALQEELAAVIEVDGTLLDSNNNQQLLKAIRRLGSTYLAKSVAGGADVVLTEVEAQNAVIALTGAITANINVIVPATGRDWVFINATTGAFTVTVKTQLGGGVAVTPAAPLHLYCDGAAVGAVGASGTQKQIQPVSALAAANAMTLTLGATSLDFRSSSLNSGTVNTRAISAPLSLVIPSGATLGTASGVAARLALLAIDNDGTVELAVVNIAGSVNLDESTLISTTAISAGAGSAGVIYSAAARASVPFRVVGYFDVTQAAAGTWASAPTTTQGRGGLAANLANFGSGYAYQNNGRSSGVTYWNTSGRTIWILATSSGQPYHVISGFVNGSGILTTNTGGASYSQVGSVCFPVPHGASYRVDVSAGSPGSYLEFR
ncbi:hypothetical protein [Pseudomonas anguilliseptica]|uniref:Phage tail-collar fibre protein n=1 Tax=Pseudomonas anguilliseptica TaxID=53406 RepID=A0A1H4V111_PSEAG|nr:hypothetical protein [Pseudomonas anguilliseptica]SEC74656.1 hypothetical protein SAMN05421553_1374 [Pseudomonas anguilliseptica]